ncbi:leucyl-tRNA synthetase, Domain 2 family protein, partial [Chlamydia psittaci 01DC11]
YIEDSKTKTDLERSQLNKDKTGVFTGSYVTHPLTKKDIPI